MLACACIRRFMRHCGRMRFANVRRPAPKARRRRSFGRRHGLLRGPRPWIFALMNRSRYVSKAGTTKRRQICFLRRIHSCRIVLFKTPLRWGPRPGFDPPEPASSVGRGVTFAWSLECACAEIQTDWQARAHGRNIRFRSFFLPKGKWNRRRCLV